MHTPIFAASLLTAMLLCAGTAANAADAKDTPEAAPAAVPAPGPLPGSAAEQVIVPEVDRRDVKLPRIPSNDFEMGLFVGRYAMQNFGSSTVKGVRLGYHLTEDFFVEGAYGQTRISDEAFRQILPGGVLDSADEKLAYYNLSVGINVLPGEVFLGRNTAKASTLYLIGGVGSTKFDNIRRQTINFGFGSRVFFADWMALQLDVRDHMFDLDLLGKREHTQNIEMSVGLTFFF